MPSNEQLPQDSPPVATEALYLISTFGFFMYILWEILGMLQVIPFLPTTVDPSQLLLGRPLCFFMLLLGIIAARVFPHFMTTHINGVFVFAAVTAFLTLITSMMASSLHNISHALSVMIWLLYGSSLASIMLLWSTFFSCYYTPSMQIVMLAGFTAALVVFFGLSYVGAMQQTYVLMGFVMIVTTFTILGFIVRTIQPKLKKFTQMPGKLDPVVAIHSAPSSILYGLSLVLIIMLGENAALISVSSAFTGCTAAWLTTRKSRISDDIFVRRVTFAPVIVALVFLPIGGSIGQIICSFLIIGACFFTAMSSWINISEESSRQKINPIALFAQKKVSGWSGFFIGTVLGPIVLLSGEELFSIVTACTAALLGLSFAVFELHTNKKNRNTINVEDNAGRYKKRCEHLAEHSRLSARELEVLYLLAKGRNAEHIADRLCIAKPTVKTHIQHIYQKTNVNTQQALIDRVDQL
jgi:DNA-binding CsgD family transcriptional regulator